MQSIEFKSNTRNGIVKLPEIYRDWFDKTVKVILVREPETGHIVKNAGNQDLKEFFYRFEVDMNDWRFDRDEANER
jgi:hypothetical protein